jgi:hypothetical protein
MTKRTRMPANNMTVVENALGEFDVVDDGQWIAGPFATSPDAWAWISQYEDEQAQRRHARIASMLEQFKVILENGID